MKKILLIAALVIILVQTSSATYISMSSRIQVERVVNQGNTPVNVSVVNLGDEAAYSVQLTLILPEGFNSESHYIGNMPPKVPVEKIFDVTLPEDVLPGKYVIGLIIDYSDANGYPFSAISPGNLVIKEPSASKVTGAIDEVTIGTKGEGKLKVKLRNLDNKAHDVKVRLMLPRELNVDLEENVVYMPAKSEEEVTFKISSFGALAGSKYVAMAAIESTDDMHYSSIARGFISIVEEKNPFSIPKMLPFFAIGALILVFLVLQLRK